MNFADLHLHTAYSDSTYSVEELIRESIKADLSAIAIVDHDTVDGIAPALEIGKKKKIEVLPGIELTAERQGLEIHILGYLIDYQNKGLNEKILQVKQDRANRVYKIVSKLNALGVKLKAKAVFDLAGRGTVSRLHIARTMVKEKIVGSILEAFQKYIGDKCEAYVSGFRFSVQEAIEIIKLAGGIPVLAHPYSLHNDELIPQFVEYGIMGIEAYYPEHSQGMVNLYLELAKKYNLLVTGGSDCHGQAKPEVRIGSIKIPYELVEELKRAKEKV